MGIWAESFQVCLFDMRRGHEEGHELDKILFFAPSDLPLPSQLSVVGLSEGLITFTKIFSPNAPCEVMEAERRCHIFHQCEPEIWMVMVVEKKKDTNEPTRDGAVRALLKEAHILFTTFFGSIRALLEKHPAGDVARCCLFSFLPDYFADFMVGKKLRLPSSADTLTERGMVERLPLLPEALYESQALVGMMQSWSDSEYVVHAIITFQNQLIASTLPPDDTSALFSYANLRMRPGAVSYATSMRASYRRSYSAGVSDRHSSIPRSQSMSRSNSLVDPNLQCATSVPRSSSSMGDTKSIPKPLLRDAWFRGRDNFLCTDAWGLDSAGGSPELPIIWLQGSTERMFLSAYQHKLLTLLLIVPARSSSDVTHMKDQLVEQAAVKIQRLEERLAKEWGGPNASHIPSYRYLYLNVNLKVAQSSPASKVTTLAKDTLTALSRVRAEVDLERGRLARKDPTSELELELSMRTKNNAWVVARTRNGHELYTALEKSGDTLLSAAGAMERLSARYFDKRFTSG